MEIKSTIHRTKGLVRIYCCLLLFLFAGYGEMQAQALKSYTVKNGMMYISLSKQLSEPSLDSFISQYSLQDLALKEFINKGFEDSLKKLGWVVAMNTPIGCMLSKPLAGFSKISSVADRISFIGKNPTVDEMFPAVHNSIVYGYNRFRNKSPFSIRDSDVTFYLRNNNNARKVMLSGSFNEWNPDNLSMSKTDSGWIVKIKLSPGKYWYKFIVDGNWTVDNDNRLSENDGLGNMNSVYYKTNFVFRLNSYTNAKRVYLSGSFNNWDPNGLLMNKTETGWELPLYLADGTHTYRLVVDGKWIEDPGNPEHLPNEFGEFNSVLRMGKSYVFKLDGYPDAKKVVIAGSFNGWRNNELFMTKTPTGWQLSYTFGPGNYEYRILVDGKRIADHEPLIIDPNYTFKLKYPTAKKVYLAGDFNNWSETGYLMKKSGDEWVFTVNLSRGKHLYKFIVDGKWIIDPANKLWEQNEQNTGNSVLWIGK